MVQHIGYFNDPEDIQALAKKTPEAIVRYYKRGEGAFITSEDPEDGNAQGLRPVMVGKQKYYVRKAVSMSDLESWDNFIDIYKVV